MRLTLAAVHLEFDLAGVGTGGGGCNVVTSYLCFAESASLRSR